MILLWNLKNFFTRNRWLAVAFMLLLVVCLAGTLFGVNYIFCNMDAYNMYLTEQNSYQVSGVNGGGNELGSLLRRVADQYGDELFMATAEFVNRSPSAEPLVEEDGTSERYDTITAVFQISETILQSVRGGSEELLSIGQVERGEKVILLDPEIYGSEYAGKTYLLNGEAFRVVGFSTLGNMVSFYALEDTDTIADLTLTMSLSRRLSEQEIDGLDKALRTQLDNVCIRIPQEDVLSFWDFLPALVPTLILVAFGFINLSFLYTYFVSMRRRTYGVLRLCGAGSGRIFFLFLGEALSLFTGAFIVALAVFKIVMPFMDDLCIAAAAQTGVLLSDRMMFGRWIILYAVAAGLFTFSFLPSMVRALRVDTVVRAEE